MKTLTFIWRNFEVIPLHVKGNPTLTCKMFPRIWKYVYIPPNYIIILFQQKKNGGFTNNYSGFFKNRFSQSFEIEISRWNSKENWPLWYLQRDLFYLLDVTYLWLFSQWEGKWKKELSFLTEMCYMKCAKRCGKECEGLKIVLCCECFVSPLLFYLSYAWYYLNIEFS